MLPITPAYAVFPAVYPADTPAVVTVVPRERTFLPVENEEYTLRLIAVDGDEPDYYNASAFTELTVVARGGAIQFTYAFPGEQEHRILLFRGEKQLQIFTVYSLYGDLYGLRPMKGDLHSHSHRSDGQCDPGALAGHYREQGYDFFALTDHNRYAPGQEIDDAYRGVELGITRVSGEEIHAPDSAVHLVHVGGRFSVAELYVHHREDFEREVGACLQRVPEGLPEIYHGRYARALWAADRVREAGGLLIFPHPFWRPGRSKMHSVRTELARILLTSGLFDAYELVGGMGQMGVNESVALWGDLRADGLRLPVVGSSDAHALEKSDCFPNLFTVCFAADRSAEAIVDAVRGGRCVAVEATGSESDREYRCYGSFRLVAYAQFLLRHYFPQQQRICQGEGVAMRAFLMGEAEPEIIEAQARGAESFRRRFFGQEPPVLPSAGMLAFEEKWRAVQLNGPLTKGSSLVAPPVTRQI